MIMDSEHKQHRFGKYQILEELGRGGFGTVYKAQDTVLGRLVAIKILHAALVIESNFIERFRQEARTAAMLDHPNLVPVFDFGETEGRYYIAMGYMPGGSLKDLLKREGKLEPNRACEVLAQVSEGLEYAHARGIIHRDLKPGNILFDDNGKARMADMGFAKVMSEGTSRSMSTSGGLVGTPAYMAPETWRNKPATPQTDIYSLGCILYEILTGKVLFEGESPAEIMTMHMIDGPQYDMDLSQEFRPVLDKALQRDPQERYPETITMLSNLRSALTATEKEQLGNQEINISEYSTLIGHSGKVRCVTWSPDGKRLASGCSDGNIIIWHTETGERLRILEGHTQSVSSVAWSPDGKTLASASWDTTINIWNADSGTIFRRLLGHELNVTSVAWSMDGNCLASGSWDSTIIIWNTGRDICVKTLDVRPQFINCLAWSPNGKMLASGGEDGSIVFWDTDRGTRLHTLKAYTDWVNSVSWSPDGKRLASGSFNDNVTLWYVDTGEKIRQLEGHKGNVVSVAWSLDGKTLASGSWDGTIIIWNAISGERLRTLEGHTSEVTSIAWSPDGKTLASGGGDGTIRFWGIP